MVPSLPSALSHEGKYQVFLGGSDKEAGSSRGDSGKMSGVV